MWFIGSETTYGISQELIILTLPSPGLRRCIKGNSHLDVVPMPATGD
jgi:hypothetical protein